MKSILNFLLALLWVSGFAQPTGKFDSLKRELGSRKDDTERILLMIQIGTEAAKFNIDSAILYDSLALSFAKEKRFSKEKIKALRLLGDSYRRAGEIPTGLQLIYEALQMAKEERDSNEIASCYRNIGLIYVDLDEYPLSIENFRLSLKIRQAILDEQDQAYLLMRIGYAYFKNNQIDSASVYMEKANARLDSSKLMADFYSLFDEFMGDFQFHLGQKEAGIEYLRKSIGISKKNNFHLTAAVAYNIMSGFFKETGQIDSAIEYAKKGLAEARLYGVRRRILDASILLAELYETKDIKSALYYRKLFDSTNEELYGRKNVQRLQKTLADEQDRIRRDELKAIDYQNRIKQYALVSGLSVFLLLALILYLNNRQKQKTNKILENTLSELKSTQSQLIHSEKMASLGELAAGVAHEIQNPLNFVTNFSEVNKELIVELDQELDNKNFDGVRSIIGTMNENEEKIRHHAGRADSIVKSMLLHSKISTGQKQMTDINVLTDEYLRVSYHGMRAKDKSFQCALNEDFDLAIAKINVVPQDIGRVLMNIFNNAFYAIAEKRNKAGDNFIPAVTVTTKSFHSASKEYRIKILVRDNGGGIPSKTIDKIFQPFFTTKPPGQGTGLGLSISYDIVKAHGGELKAESKEGEYAEFIIEIPVNRGA